MTRFLLEAFLQVSIPLSLAFFLVKNKKKENYRRIFFFALLYVFYQMVLVLPRLSEKLNLIDSRWNWDGKAFGILFGVICYLVFRKYFSENDFFTVRQEKDNFKKSLITAVLAVFIVTVIAFFAGSDEFNAETLVFQLTMPGIDEEIMFRGILLGLLMTALRDKIGLFGNPAVLLTAILFGLMHALTLDKDYSISFEPVYFLHTGIGGYVFGWITMKSRSILLAILSHGFANFFAAAASMLK